MLRLFLLLIYFLSTSVNAQQPTCYYAFGAGTSTIAFTSASAACSQLAAQLTFQPQIYGSYGSTGASGGLCPMQYSAAPPSTATSNISYQYNEAPCPPPQVTEPNPCRDKKAKPAGSWNLDIPITSPVPLAFYVCAFDSCLVVAEVSFSATYGDTRGLVGEGFWTGDKCVGGGNGLGIPPSTPDTTKTGASPHPNPPPPGKCPGTINGVEVFVNCTSTSTTSTSSTTSTTGSGTNSSSTGSQTTSNTECANGRCTTTQTTTPTNTNGQPTGSPTSTTTTQDQSIFCERNPSNKICKSADGSAFGGSCESSFQCTGDAAICASAKGVWESRCALKSLEGDKSNPLYAIGSDASNGMQPADHPRASKTTLALSLNQANPYSSACPPDIPITVAGFSLAIPLAAKCSTFVLMGNLLVSFTLVVAAFIVTRGS